MIESTAHLSSFFPVAFSRRPLSIRAIITSVDFTIAIASSPRAQLEGANRIRCDDRRQHLIADAKPNLREQAVDPNLFDESVQAIASAQLGDRFDLDPWRGSCDRRPLTLDEPVDLRAPRRGDGRPRSASCARGRSGPNA